VYVEANILYEVTNPHCFLSGIQSHAEFGVVLKGECRYGLFLKREMMNIQVVIAATKSHCHQGVCIRYTTKAYH
jgi:hypothetical protein